MKDGRKRNHVQIVVAACVLLLLGSLIALILRWPEGARPKYESTELPQNLTQPDTGVVVPPLISDSIPAPPVALSPVAVSAEPGKPAIPKTTTNPPGRERPDYSPVNISGRVDSWEDWNSSFSDSISRTYSVIFDSALLDQVPGGQMVFSPTGRRSDFLPVKRVFCAVDSVRPLVKYTFPGQDVDFVIGVGFASGISLRGALEPQARTCELEPINPEYQEVDASAKVIRNQFVVQLSSTPGFAYVIRTGIECASAREGNRSRIFYLRPSAVEFRRMIKYSLLARDAADTVLILTANPKAIVDLSDVVRRSVLKAVFVPAKDPDEADDLWGRKLPNVELHVTSPRVIGQSFVVFSDSEALIERNTPDPDFVHTVQLNLKLRKVDRIGYPRVTNLTTDPSAILELKRAFRHLEDQTSF